MNRYQKRDLPVAKVRRFLEPGPIVLVSSKWRGPSLIGCYIWDANHSFEMLRRSKECVINIPTEDIAANVWESVIPQAATLINSRSSD